MTVIGGTSDGWYLIDRDGAKEYREVSTDGTEKTTQQQQRSHETIVREQIHCHDTTTPIEKYSTDEGATVSTPEYKASWGTTGTAPGDWIIVSDRFSVGEKGSSRLTNTQVLKKWSVWADVPDPTT